MTFISQPGMYDLPADEYHADPVPGGSLSSTIARKLLPPSCPALARWAMDHPDHKPAWDLGGVTHRLILGKGDSYREVPYPNWRTNAATELANDARADGLTPLLSHELRKAELMAQAVLTDPVAGPLFAPTMGGIAEQTIIYIRDGVWWRTMLDWLITSPGGPPIIVDVKTTGKSAHPDNLGRIVADLAYHQQAAAYVDAVYSLGYEGVLFLFVFVESSPPHLVTVGQLDEDDITAGWEANERAARIWTECRETGIWPGYSTEIVRIKRPRWAK